MRAPNFSKITGLSMAELARLRRIPHAGDAGSVFDSSRREGGRTT
jgi:hypothetical protein